VAEKLKKDDRVSVIENEVTFEGSVSKVKKDGTVCVDFDNEEYAEYGLDELSELTLLAPKEDKPKNDKPKKGSDDTVGEPEEKDSVTEAKATAQAKIDIAKKPAKTREAAPKLVTAEREFRRYVKREGGLRKNLSDSAIKEAHRIAKILGREEVKLANGKTGYEWDITIEVPGMPT